MTDSNESAPAPLKLHLSEQAAKDLKRKPAVDEAVADALRAAQRDEKQAAIGKIRAEKKARQQAALTADKDLAEALGTLDHLARTEADIRDGRTKRIAKAKADHKTATAKVIELERQLAVAHREMQQAKATLKGADESVERAAETRAAAERAAQTYWETANATWAAVNPAWRKKNRDRATRKLGRTLGLS